jgi:type III secretion protein Q
MIPLRRLRKTDAEALNRIYRRRETVPVAIGDSRLRLQFRPAALPPAAPLPVELEIDGRGAALEVETALADMLLATVDRGLALKRLDAELAAMILEMALAPLLRRLEAGSGRRFALRRIGDAPVDGKIALPLAFLPENGDGVPLPACLHVDPASLPLVAGLVERLPLDPGDTEALMIELACRVGMAELTREELATLAPGDLVVMTRTRAGAGEIDLVVERALVFPARITQTTATLAGGGRRAVAEENAAGDGTPVAEIADLDSVPVTLVFEIGRLRLPLGELRTLAPGFSFDLGRDLRAPVDILVGGRKIGTGELVQIDERLGVRVSKLFET